MKLTPFKTFCACVIGICILSLIGIYNNDRRAKIKQLDYKYSIDSLKREDSLNRSHLSDSFVSLMKYYKK